MVDIILASRAEQTLTHVRDNLGFNPKVFIIEFEAELDEFFKFYNAVLVKPRIILHFLTTPLLNKFIKIKLKNKNTTVLDPKITLSLKASCKLTKGLTLENTFYTLTEEKFDKNKVIKEFQKELKGTGIKAKDLPDDKNSLITEIKRIGILKRADVPNEAIKSAIVKDYADKELFVFISSLIDKNLEEYLSLYGKLIAKFNRQHLVGMIYKKLFQTYFMSIGDLDEANRYWRISPYVETFEVSRARSLDPATILKTLRLIDTLRYTGCPDNVFFKRLIYTFINS